MCEISVPVKDGYIHADISSCFRIIYLYHKLITPLRSCFSLNYTHPFFFYIIFFFYNFHGNHLYV